MRGFPLLASLSLLSCAAAPPPPSAAPPARAAPVNAAALRPPASSQAPPPIAEAALPAPIAGLIEPDLVVRCDLRAVQGSTRAGRSDPALRFLRGQQRRLPLSRYKQLSQLSRHQLQLQPRAAQALLLGERHKVQLTLLERVPWLPQRELYRLRLEHGIGEGTPGTVQLVTLQPGKALVVAGGDGVADLLLVLTCRRGSP